MPSGALLSCQMMTDYNAQSTAASTSHRTYVENLLKYYQENDIRLGDPNEGEWEDAHYPVPKRLGGCQTVALLREHHAIQGVLQSEEFECACVSPRYDRYLRGTEWEDLYLKWIKETGAEGGRVGGASAWKMRGLKHIEAAVAARSKAVVFEKDGELYKFPSLRKGCHTLGLNIGAVCHVIQGKRNHHKGYTAHYD